MTTRTVRSPRLLRALVLATAFASPAYAQTPAEHELLRSELARLRTELESLREEFNRRLDDLRAAVAAPQAQPARVDAFGDDSYELCILQHWDPSAALIERFNALTPALLRHAKVSSRLRENGWRVIDHADAGRSHAGLREPAGS